MKRLLVTALFLAASSVSANEVRMTSDYICHEPGTAWYEKITDFLPYETIEACLNAGGYAPDYNEKRVVDSLYGSKTKKPYKREFFGGDWADYDQDCRNTRAELLAELSTSKVHYRSNGCTVDRGKWISPFTNGVFYKAKELEVDHVYPLALAWKRGAYSWPYALRLEFANDKRNLHVVEKNLNRAKGAKSIDRWLPPTNRCEYVYKFVRIAKTYSLPLTEGEKSVLNRCKSGFEDKKSKPFLDLGILKIGGSFESKLGSD